MGRSGKSRKQYEATRDRLILSTIALVAIKAAILYQRLEARRRKKRTAGGKAAPSFFVRAQLHAARSVWRPGATLRCSGGWASRAPSSCCTSASSASPSQATSTAPLHDASGRSFAQARRVSATHGRRFCICVASRPRISLRLLSDPSGSSPTPPASKAQCCPSSRSSAPLSRSRTLRNRACPRPMPERRSIRRSGGRRCVRSQRRHGQSSPCFRARTDFAGSLRCSSVES